MGFHEDMAAVAGDLLFHTGEEVAYTPSGGTARNIVVLWESAGEAAEVERDGRANLRVAMVTARRDATAGMVSVTTGDDTLTRGGVDYRVSRVIEETASWLRVEVKSRGPVRLKG